MKKEKRKILKKMVTKCPDCGKMNCNCPDATGGPGYKKLRKSMKKC